MTSPASYASCAESGSASSAIRIARARPIEAATRRGRAAVGHQPDPGEGQQERRGLGGDDDVGGQRGRAADAGGDAVDRGHDRLVAADDRPDDPVRGVEGA